MRILYIQGAIYSGFDAPEVLKSTFIPQCGYCEVWEEIAVTVGAGAAPVKRSPSWM